MLQKHRTGERYRPDAPAEQLPHGANHAVQAVRRKRTALGADVDGARRQAAHVDGQLHHERQLHAELRLADAGRADELAEAAHGQTVAGEPVEAGTAERDVPVGVGVRMQPVEGCAKKC